MADIEISPSPAQPARETLPMSAAQPKPESTAKISKTLVTAVVAVVLIAIIGFSILFTGNDSTSQFEGMIKKVEKETQQLKNKAE